MGDVKDSIRVQRSTYHLPIVRDESACIACNTCVEVCMNDVHIPNPVAGKPPITLHADDCWYCGSCVMECPQKDSGAITLKYPMQINLQWKRKSTGEVFRLGMANPPAPNTTPPVGGWDTLRPSKMEKS